MVLNDTLANVLSQIMSFEKIGKKEVIIKYDSKIIRKTLDVLKDKKYIGSYEVINDSKGNKIKLHLLSNINKCGVIKPRYSVKFDDYEKFEQRYLPSKDFGLIIVSTSKGIMTNDEAKEKGVGGRLLAYCY
ncbi:30S ribosomal protein S8 [Candidatus Woesearchaeota archaeon]|nr:30S ribosomal protein S8 [Candidatus Woesearchaeota archaeon]